jgi:hypothetical protein
MVDSQQRLINNDEDDSDESLRSANPNMTPAEAMAATMTLREDPNNLHLHPQQQQQRRTNDTATAAERAIMGTIDPDENIADFIFQDENGQLVQQRFLQFLNT